MKWASLQKKILLLLLLIAAEGRAQSALDGFDPGANNSVYAMAVQPDGKIIVVGDFTTLGGGGTGVNTRNRIGRLNADGTLDASFDPGANGTVYALALQADGKILVGGQFTALGGGGTGTNTRLRLGRLNADGTLDSSFDAKVTTNFGTVYSLAVQADGKILVGGDFDSLGDQNTTQLRKFIGRFTAAGLVDFSFDPGANSPVRALAEQRDNKILVAGSFSMLGGGGTGTTSRQKIGRLLADGTLDPNFDPGANSTVRALAVQADGKILVGGTFAMLGGGGSGMTPRSRIGRLNADGTLDTNFDPGADNNVFAVTLQTDGKILLAGNFTNLGGGGSGMTLRSRIGRLNPDGTLDSTFDPGANFSINALALQADGKILAGGFFTMLGGGGSGLITRHRIARLQPEGILDRNFEPGADSDVLAMAVQADGKIVVGGYFFHLGGGGTGTITRNRIGRVNGDGTLDDSFEPGVDSHVYALAVQRDDKILVGGAFNLLGGGGIGTTSRAKIGRLYPNGALDLTFNPGANSVVYAFALQPDGKILVVGDFTMLGGGTSGTTARSKIGRLHPNGALDTDFNPGANNIVHTVALQPDGKIIVGGLFTMLGGGGTGTTPRQKIGRLNADGTLDSSFDPGVGAMGSVVYALTVQPDGKILVGGNFVRLGGGGTGTFQRHSIGRLHPDGTPDLTFDPGCSGLVEAFALQTDGKIVAVGNFTFLGGGGMGVTPRSRIGRLHPDGGIDLGFDPGTDGVISSVALQGDGKILVGGSFTKLGGGGFGTTPRNKFGRLTNTGAALQDLSIGTDGTSITWNRSGVSPELGHVTFELSTDAINYTVLANPIRIGSGWELTGQSLPTNQNIFIRARGFYPTARYDGSGSIVETMRNAFISATLTPTKIVSEKTHGANPFGIDLPLTGSPGVECRTGGPTNDHQVIVTFAAPVTVNGSPQAQVTSGTGEVGTGGVPNGGAVGINGAVVTVPLTNTANAQTIVVTLFGVDDGTSTGDVNIPMGVLLGDTTGNGSVNASDVSQTKSKSGQAVDATNFRTDATVTNSINSSDVSLVKSKSGTALP